MDTQRLILFLVFSFSILFLWEGMRKDESPKPTAAPVETAPGTTIPSAAVPPSEKPGVEIPRGQRIKVETDLFIGEIDTNGGDLRRIDLVRYLANGETKRHLTMFSDQAGQTYVAQSGLLGAGLPNHRTVFNAAKSEYRLDAGQDRLEVRLSAPIASGVAVTKIFTFRRGSYVIDVDIEVNNGGAEALIPNAYYQLVRNGDAPEGESMWVQTFTGAAVYTDKEKFQKVSFEEIADGKTKYPRFSGDGWIGIVQHHFFSAWLPVPKQKREFFTKQLGENLYAAGTIIPGSTMVPGAAGKVAMKLFVGPQDQAMLESLESYAPGLRYTVDYGWLTVIATPIFWLLSSIHALVGNWGWAIILLTVLIKSALYPLSAASYRSMAQMRKLAPRLQRMKEQYGDDRQKLHQGMMELYKTEKINPLGGCLPIVMQIPVFIALYWVLLGSVEMRQAPWMLWITDLSTKDPYYVLPVIMGATMIIQTKLSPTPPDPVQAKIMMIMPIVFSVTFIFFPAGLVLYWLVNNVLSIAQQWYVNRSIERSR